MTLDDCPFHKHLDECAQCRTYPFQLCATGDLLLRLAAGKAELELREKLGILRKVEE